MRRISLVVTAMKPRPGPPKFIALPSACASPTTMSAPSLPGASRSPSETGSATDDEERAGRVRQLGDGGQVLERAEEVGLLDDDRRRVRRRRGGERRPGRSAAPASRPTVCGRGPYPADSVASTCRYSGCTPAERTTSPRCVCTPARNEASASAVPPSYMEALLTSMPVSSQITVWNSKMVWSTPWLRSGW